MLIPDAPFPFLTEKHFNFHIKSKVTRYVYLLTLHDRKRHEPVTERGKVIRFVVQYETFIEGEWRPVIRYDTAHGFPHVDRIRPDGTVEKISLLTKDLKGGADVRRSRHR